MRPGSSCRLATGPAIPGRIKEAVARETVNAAPSVGSGLCMAPTPSRALWDGGPPVSRGSLSAARRRAARFGELTQRLVELQTAVGIALRDLREMQEELRVAGKASDDGSGTESSGVTGGRECCVCLQRCNTHTRCFHPLCRGCRDQLRDGRCPMCRIPLAGWLVPGPHFQLPTANAGDDAHGRGDDPGSASTSLGLVNRR